MQKIISIAMLSLFLVISCSLLNTHHSISQEQQQKLQSIREIIYQGRFKNAQTELAFFNKKPDSSLFYFLSGFIEEKVNKNLKRSVKYYKKGLKLLPSSEKDPLLEAQLSFYLAYDYARLKNKKLSQLYLNNTLSLLEKLNKQNKLQSGIGDYFLAYCYNKHNNPDLALQFYQKSIDWLIQNHPDYFYLAGAYFNTGLIYYNQSNLKQAVFYWQKAYDTEPDAGYYKNIYYQWLVIAQESLKNNEE